MSVISKSMGTGFWRKSPDFFAPANGHVLQVRNEDPSKVQPWRAWLPKLKDAIPCTEKPCIDWKTDLKHESAEPWVDWIKSAGYSGITDIVPSRKFGF